MADDRNNINIKINTTADTAGADQTIAALKKVEAEQAKVGGPGGGGRYGNPATNVLTEDGQLLSAEMAAKEKAAARLAVLESNKAAAAEAAAVRAERAAAKVIAAEQAEAAAVEAAALKETAALEAKALKDEARGAKTLVNAAVRFATPRNRELAALQSVANSPAAIESLKVAAESAGGATVIALGTVAAAFVTTSKVFGALEGQFNSVAEGSDKVKEKFSDLGTVISTLAHPWDTFKAMAGSAIEGTLGLLDKLVLGGALASVKQAQAAIQMADEMKAAYEKAAAAHEEMVRRMRADAVALLLQHEADEAKQLVNALENANKVAAAQGDLQRGRAGRSGASGGSQAVDDVRREVAADQNTLAIAKVAVAEADRKLANAIGSVAIDAAQTEADIARSNLKTLAETQTANLTNAAEAANATVTKDFEAVATQQAQDLKSQLEAIQSRDGPNTSAAVLQALQTVNQILEDGKASLNEAGKLASAFDSYRQSAEAATQAQQKSITAIITFMDNAEATARSQATQIAEILARQVSQQQ